MSSHTHLHLELIREKAKAHGLDPLLLQAIVEVESAGRTYAMRYEPHWRYMWFPREWASKMRVTEATEHELQKFSYGLGQVVGAVARQHGFDGPLVRLCEPEIGLEYMCLHLKWLRVKCASEADLIASYNGGWGALKKLASGMYANQNYVNKVHRVLHELRRYPE